MNSPKKHYILAEKLWADGKYQASVREFDRVIKKDPNGKLGLQALFRSAMTQTIFLSKHVDAVQRFRAYISRASDPDLIWSAHKQVGEILFTKLRRFKEAVDHYREMLEQNPDSGEAPELWFRLARGHFFLWNFEKAIEIFRQIEKTFPGTQWAERSAYEIGVSYYTGGEQEPGGYGESMETYRQAIKAYERFIQDYPKSPRVPEARFGIASCYEEMDQLDAAHMEYEKLLEDYPSPKVIQIKLTRIRERMAQKKPIGK